MTRDDQVAAMLEAGATHRQIKQQLQVSDKTLQRVRVERRILLPPGRAKRTRAEIDALEPQAIAMLLSGATAQEIYKRLRFGLNEIARLRRELGLPVPNRDLWASTRLTVDEAFTLYAKPTTTGEHLLWIGPRAGRSLEIYASGRRHNARHVAFRHHHGRDPDGYVRRTCEQPGCIHGAHHTDHTIRTQPRNQPT